jgi:calcium-dependent protein kinase
MSTSRHVLFSYSSTTAAFFQFFTGLPEQKKLTRLVELAECDNEPVNLGWLEFDPSRFHLKEELGHGSFGTVHQAVDAATGVKTAVKTMAKLLRNQKPAKTAAKLKREAHLLHMLQSCTEHVVTFHGAYEDEHNAYLVTEVLNGGTLEDFQAAFGGKLDEPTLQWVGADVLSFILACHTLDVVYADAKPANFMLDNSDGQWNVKAIDLGCSQLLSHARQRLEHRSGTPLYFAPEVFQRSYGKEADIWSVGVLFYQLITGHNPWFYSLKGVSPATVQDKVLGEEVPYLEADWKDVSPDLKNLVQRMLCKSVHSRITAADALKHPFFQNLECIESNILSVPDGKLSSLFNKVKVVN